MSPRMETEEARELLVLISGWFLSSVLAAYTGKTLLHQLTSAVQLSVIQSLFSAVVGVCVMLAWQKRVSVLSPRDIATKIAPLALFQSSYSVNYNVAMRHVPVSYLNTVKTSIPIYTCVLCRLYFSPDRKFSLLTYVSLAVLLGGIVMASLYEPNFAWLGLFFASFSALSQSLFNLATKKLMSQAKHGYQKLTQVSLNATEELDQISLLFYNSCVSLVFMVPLLVLVPLPSAAPSVSLLLLTGGTYYAETLFTYLLLRRMRALAFSVTDVVRRLLVIVSSAMYFGNPLTGSSMLGVLAALGGVVVYNISVNEAAQGPLRRLVASVGGDPRWLDMREPGARQVVCYLDEEDEEKQQSEKLQKQQLEKQQQEKQQEKQQQEKQQEKQQQQQQPEHAHSVPPGTRSASVMSDTDIMTDDLLT